MMRKILCLALHGRGIEESLGAPKLWRHNVPPISQPPLFVFSKLAHEEFISYNFLLIARQVCRYGAKIGRNCGERIWMTNRFSLADLPYSSPLDLCTSSACGLFRERDGTMWTRYGLSAE
jgi:hypothetical protein